MATEPLTLTNGTTADANDVMALFNEIYGNIDETNVAAGNKTGTGKFVLQTSPTITTPSITSPTITTGTFNGNSTFDTDTLFVDATNNRVGVGTTGPLVRLHVVGGGAPTAGASGCQAVFQNFANAADLSRVTILSGNAGQSILELGDSDDVDIGAVIYDHSTNALTLRTNNATALTVSSAGNGTFAGTSQATQFISTIATGTAPLVVSSTTKVSNLNADLLDGLDSTAFLRPDVPYNSLLASGFVVATAVTARTTRATINYTTAYTGKYFVKLTGYIECTLGDASDPVTTTGSFAAWINDASNAVDLDKAIMGATDNFTGTTATATLGRGFPFSLSGIAVHASSGAKSINLDIETLGGTNVSSASGIIYNVSIFRVDN